MATTQTTWRITGDYFENCNCDVVCPCLFSPGPPMTARPTAGACEVPLAFHIERGTYGDVPLDGLNAVVALRTPGVMSEGNASVALYLDDRADGPQRAALQAIFSGAAGGPPAALAPIITTVLGVKTVPIRWHKDGKRRAVEIPGIANLAVRAVPSMNPDGEIWASNAHPLAMDKLAMAVGEENSTFSDYGMRWDNSGKNGHYAAINWSVS
jgi:hypothetical protein